MADAVDLALALDHAEFTDQGCRVDQFDAVEPAADFRQIVQWHAHHRFASEFRSDTAEAAPRPAQRRRQQRYAVVIGLGRRPGADVLDPGYFHGRRADFRDHRDGLALPRYQQEPGPCRAFPELRIEAAEVAHVGRRRDQNAVQFGLQHQGLGAAEPVFEFRSGKSAGGLGGGDGGSSRQKQGVRRSSNRFPARASKYARGPR